MNSKYPLAEQAYAIVQNKIPTPATIRMQEGSLFRGDDLEKLNTIVFLELTYRNDDNGLPIRPLRVLEEIYRSFPDADIRFDKKIEMEEEYTIAVKIHHG